MEDEKEKHVEVQEINILILCAGENVGDAPSHWPEEVNVIKKIYEKAGAKAKFNSIWQVAKQDIATHLAQLRPNILHIIAHGQVHGAGEIMFQGQPIAPANLVEILAGCGHPLECLIISACNFREEAANYTKCCKFLIACSGKLEAETAIEFSSGFYATLFANPAEITLAINAGIALQTATSNGELLAIKQRQRSHPSFALQAVEKNENRKKWEAYFGIPTENDCPISGLVAEFGGYIEAVHGEPILIENLKALQQAAIYLENALTSPGADSYLQSVETIRALLHTLYGACITTIELQSLQLSDPEIELKDTEEFHVISITFACKLAKQPGAAGAIKEFMKAVSFLVATDESHPGNEPLKCKMMMKQLTGALKVIIDCFMTCTEERFRGFTRALRDQFPRSQDVNQRVSDLVSNLPHYSALQYVGKSLWTRRG